MEIWSLRGANVTIIEYDSIMEVKLVSVWEFVIVILSLSPHMINLHQPMSGQCSISILQSFYNQSFSDLFRKYRNEALAGNEQTNIFSSKLCLRAAKIKSLIKY